MRLELEGGRREGLQEGKGPSVSMGGRQAVGQAPAGGALAVVSGQGQLPVQGSFGVSSSVPPLQTHSFAFWRRPAASFPQGSQLGLVTAASSPRPGARATCRPPRVCVDLLFLPGNPEELGWALLAHCSLGPSGFGLLLEPYGGHFWAFVQTFGGGGIFLLGGDAGVGCVLSELKRLLASPSGMLVPTFPVQPPQPSPWEAGGGGDGVPPGPLCDPPL